MQHDERRVQSSPTTRGTSFAARRAACELGAGERARVHLCHAVPRVTASCRPLYLLIIIGLRTINDANYSFLLIAYTAVHDTSRYTSAQHDKNEEGGAGSAGAVGAAAAAAAAAAADPVLAKFERLRKECAPGVCWSTPRSTALSEAAI